MKSLKELKFTEQAPVTAYHRTGKGRTVVLLHGYLESSELWESLAGNLAGDYRVVVPDLPGHGKSPVPEGNPSLEKMARGVFNVLDELEADRVTLVGHSMGGYVALAMAALQPERLEGFCLFHSTPFADNAVKKGNRDRAVNLIRQGKKQQLVGAHAPNTFSPQNEKEMGETVEELKRLAMQTADEGVVYALRAMKGRPDRTDVLKGMKVPLLLIHGSHDRFISGDVFRSMLSIAPEAETLVLENSGHMGLLEEPQASLAGLGNFLSGINRKQDR